MVLAVLLAFGAAASFAAGSALQHRVAGASPSSDETKLGFVARLAHRPSWLVGLLLSAVAFAMHASALSQGDLALVQPVIVSGIVFAVIIRSGLEHRFPPARTLFWLVLTCAGLAVFLTERPTGQDHPPNLVAAAVVTIVGAIASVVAMLAARASRSEQQRRGIFLALAAGILFGLVAGEAKLVLRRLGVDFGSEFSYWPLYVLPVVGLTAILLNQRAYQATRLSVSAPVLNIAQVLVALAFGAIVLDEVAGSTTGQLIGQVIGLLLVIAGVVKLAAKSGVPGEDDDPKEVPAGSTSRGSRAD